MGEKECNVILKCKEYPINFDLINEIDSKYYQVKRTKATVKTTIMVKKEDYQYLEEQLLQLSEENEKLKVANEDLNDSWCDEALKIITISQQLEVAKKTLKKIANLLQVNNTIELIQSLAEIKSITEQTLKEIGE